MAIPYRIGVRGIARDPAESWEIPYTQSEGGSYFHDIRASYPRMPRREEELPPGSLESLRDLCGVEGLHQLFIIPWSVRSVGYIGGLVISPVSVLALGTKAVGLWTEKPEPGVKVSMALNEIAGVEDITILLYGRMSFISSGKRLTVRYNTVAREGLEPALLDVRGRLVGPARRMPSDDGTESELPYKWNYLLHRSRAGLEEGAPVAYRFARAPRKGRHENERGQLFVFNPYELVYMFDPIEATHLYGEDSIIVPLSRMTGVRMEGNDVEVAANGARFSLSMAPALRDAAVRWFG